VHTNLDLIGYCGLYCGACSFKLAFDEKDRAHLRGLPPRYAKLQDAVLESCPGCRKEESQCTSCGIRDCAQERGLAHCGLCAEFSCSRIVEFDGDGAPHHGESIANLKRLREVGGGLWLQEQRRCWTCPCGAKRSWYLKECPRCGGRARPRGLPV